MKASPSVKWAPLSPEDLASINRRHEANGKMLSRFLHDEIGQVLSAVGLRLDILRMDLASTVPDIVEQTSELQFLLEQAVTNIRDLSNELNPAIAERAGLRPALEFMVTRYRRRFAGRIDLQSKVTSAVPGRQATALYRIADLALSNALDGSRNSRIRIRLRSSKKRVSLEVSSQGGGKPTDRIAVQDRRMALSLMNYSAGIANIRLTVESSPGNGTVVRASYEIPGKEQDKSIE